MSDIKAVEIIGEIRPGRQMADGTINLIFNVPEYLRKQAFEIMDHHLDLAKMVIEFVPREDVQEDVKRGRNLTG